MSDTPSNTPGSEQLDEDLVAYLDGELGSADARRVEDLLASDEEARRRLNQLAASWDLLDRLPRADLDDAFTRTTVEMVALATEEELSREDDARPRKRRSRWLVGALASVLAAAAGFALVAVFVPDRNAQLLADLPAVANLELCRYVGSPAVLEGLQNLPRFANESLEPGRGGTRDNRADDVPQWQIVPPGMDARRQWTAELSTEQQAELSRNFDRWRQISPREQKSLRQVAAKLNLGEAAQPLREVVARYYRWLSSLSPIERADLSAKPDGERLAEIERLIAEQRSHLLSFVLRHRGIDNRSELGQTLRVMRDLAAAHEQEILKTLPEAARNKLLERRAEDDQRGRNRYQSQLAFELWRYGGPAASIVDADELERVIAELPAQHREKVQSAGSVDQQLDLIRSWIETTGRGQRFGPRAWSRGPQRRFDDRLERFKNDVLTGEQRDRISKLPDDERRGALVELFMKHMREQGPDGSGWLDPELRRGPGPGNDRRRPPDAERTPYRGRQPERNRAERLRPPPREGADRNE